MPLRPRPEVENLQPGFHGGLNQAELKAAGLSPETVLDFSVCANPFAPPAEVRKILATVPIDRYPDPEATEFREYLAVKLGVAPENIIAGNGAVELIRLTALTYFSPGDSVLILEPTFGEYKIASQIVGASLIYQWGQESDNFTPRIEETVSLIRQCHPKGVFLCNPNNPTGHYLTREEIERILDACGDGLLILDEAYIAFVDQGWSALGLIHRGNVILLRSMTKDYALAGLRLGYAVSNERIINALRRVCPPWNVNALAQKAGVLVLKDSGLLERCQQEIGRAKDFLVGELGRIGFSLIPSRTNFFLVKVTSAKDFRSA
ncbi:MAG: histidinol-phosphate transaminase, partial [Dehalococcoidales bacterium]|nr:histidinol-phosphate transaminase [Dehalococcoidales bacterium]